MSTLGPLHNQTATASKKPKSIVRTQDHLCYRNISILKLIPVCTAQTWPNAVQGAENSLQNSADSEVFSSQLSNVSVPVNSSISSSYCYMPRKWFNFTTRLTKHKPFTLQNTTEGQSVLSDYLKQCSYLTSGNDNSSPNSNREVKFMIGFEYPCCHIHNPFTAI